jgi:PAP2 superfamily protein
VSFAILASLRLWEAASVLFFVGILLLSPVASRAVRRRLLEIVCGAVTGLLLTYVIAVIPYTPVLHDLIGPPILLLAGYWISGRLFVAPKPDQERVLQALDDRLRVPMIAHVIPRPLAEILELAYVGVYPLLPAALVVHLYLTSDPSPERFWSVVLITDYICFVVLAWVQTRPPRALEAAEPWRSTIRSFNLRLVGATSIQVNTFPSGHAAEALVAALLVLDAPAPIVLLMFLNVLAISAGAVLGRYHYAADALAGWAVALAVWAAVG